MESLAAGFLERASMFKAEFPVVQISGAGESFRIQGELALNYSLGGAKDLLKALGPIWKDE